MNSALADLMFWIVALVALFFLFRWLQGRKKKRDDPKDER